MSTPIRNQVTIDDLPALVRIDMPQEPNTMLSTIFTVIGFACIVVGGLFIIFGPDKIYYNALEGMNLLQMIEAYPGPIASAGFVICALANRIHNSAINSYQKNLMAALDRAIQINDADLPAGYRLGLDADENLQNVYSVSLVEDDAAPAEKAAPTALPAADTRALETAAPKTAQVRKEDKIVQ